MTMQIKKAVRLQRKARIAIEGVSGSGKSMTMLYLLAGLCGDKRFAVIDSEHSSISLYADRFDFDVIELTDTSTQSYITAIQTIKAAGLYAGLGIDSGSHAWEGVNEAVNEAAKRERGGNTFQLWGKVGNPLYNSFLESILSFPGHVVMTLRSKADYVMEEYTDAGGKTRTKPKKVGLAAKFREGGEYEFDLTCRMTLEEHDLIVEKTRMPFLDNRIVNKPTEALGREIREWLAGGAEVPRGQEYLKPLTTNGVQPAVKEIPVNNIGSAADPLMNPYSGNPWTHIVQGEKNSQVGVPLCMIEDPEGKWWNAAWGKKVPNKAFTATDIAAVQKILAADNDFNNEERQAARDEYSEPLETEREIEA